LSAKKGEGRGTGTIVVIGLGRFGAHVAQSLARLGHEVLAIDEDQQVVQRWSQELTHVAQADPTDDVALRQLGVASFPQVVVDIDAVEASVLTVLALKAIGVTDIWAKATSTRHEKILSTVGATHVVFPEADMAERVSHLILSKILEFIEFDQGFAIAKTRAPRNLVGRKLADLDLGEKQGIVVIGLQRPGGRFEKAQPNMVVPQDSFLIVEGTLDQVQQFVGNT
jgi:trk system potassium uptake protein TrkA